MGTIAFLASGKISGILKTVWQVGTFAFLVCGKISGILKAVWQVGTIAFLASGKISGILKTVWQVGTNDVSGMWEVSNFWLMRIPRLEDHVGHPGREAGTHLGGIVSGEGPGNDFCKFRRNYLGQTEGCPS